MQHPHRRDRQLSRQGSSKPERGVCASGRVIGTIDDGGARARTKKKKTHPFVLDWVGMRRRHGHLAKVLVGEAHFCAHLRHAVPQEAHRLDGRVARDDGVSHPGGHVLERAYFRQLIAVVVCHKDVAVVIAFQRMVRKQLANDARLVRESEAPIERRGELLPR